MAKLMEDEVDSFLESQDGLIQRGKDAKYCHHNSRSKCAHCLPVDPYDEGYLTEKDIKHMSFHAFLRKSKAGQKSARSSAITYPLENLICRVKTDCKDHPPYPLAVCSKCQPDPVTLNRQKYRHVDNISFENELLVNNFLDFWRRTGHQRFGFLIGRFEPHLDVPLGIKAVVTAIYEPPQDSTEKSLQLLPDPHSEIVDEFCKTMGLTRVGWIFTDLTPDENTSGKMKCTRGAESYFMSAQECITAGHYQNTYPNVCKYAEEGTFGSKFVTVVASADEHGQIHFSGYQVSNQCAALVKDDWLVPTIGAPELAYVRDDQSWVPDVKYKEKDKYGNEVSKDGRPLPVEYLLIDVPAGTPKEPQFTFYVNSRTNAFPIENRMAIADLQNFDTLSTYCKQFSSNQMLEMMSNFHILLFLLVNDTCRIPLESLTPLLEAVKNQDRGGAIDWSKQNPEWATIEHLLAAHGSAQGGIGASGIHASSSQTAAVNMSDDDVIPIGRGPRGGGVGRAGVIGPEDVDVAVKWSCQHCTFENDARKTDCEMCGLPR